MSHKNVFFLTQNKEKKEKRTPLFSFSISIFLAYFKWTKYSTSPDCIICCFNISRKKK